MLLFCFVDRRWRVGSVTEKWSLKGILGGEEEGSELESGNFESGEPCAPWLDCSLVFDPLTWY